MKKTSYITVAMCGLLCAGTAHAKVSTLLACKQSKLMVETESVLASARFDSADSPQHAAWPECSSSITQCGCTIAKPGIYTVNATLMSSQGTTANGDCIDVKARNVQLFLHGFSITGAGAGAGIRLFATADNAFVEGTAAGNETTSALITEWDTGIEVDASNAIVEDFQSQSNGTARVLLTKGHNNNINDFTASNNGVYGLWIKSSNGNQINCSDTVQNTKIDVYLGCSPDGTLGSTCHGVEPSKGNRIYDHDSDNNGGAGIAIDIGNTGNFVTDTEASGNTEEDLSDQNNHCGTDVWYLNNFTKTNASCVH